MGSDSLDKLGRQRTLVHQFQIYRDQAFIYLKNCKFSWKPWICIPVLVLRILSLTWMVIVDTFELIWTYLFPSSVKVYLQKFNWGRIGFKTFSRILLTFYAWVAISLWYGSPWGPGGKWPDSWAKDIPLVKHNINDYFSDFVGAAVCDIQPVDLYAPPIKTDRGYGYATNRADVLEAMSGGGRHGFGSPYVSQGYHHRWFSVEEICTILDRFDALVFVGDQNLEMVYAGFNILLRKNLRHGALGSSLPGEKLPSCECNKQFTDPACHEYFAHESKDITTHWRETYPGAYTCQRLPHAMLRTDQSPASAEAVSKFRSLVRPAPPSNYKPIPIIHSVTNDVSIEIANSSLAEFLQLASESKRKAPMLWIGPTAAGHIDIKGRKGNQEIWRFATETSKIAQEKGVETLGLWNLTVQADSYDGKGFGEDVSIVAAMMVVNWLARLESS